MQKRGETGGSWLPSRSAQSCITVLHHAYSIISASLRAEADLAEKDGAPAEEAAAE